MSYRKYNPEVRKELKRLTDIATERDSESRLRQLAALLDDWRDGKVGPNDALQAVRSFPVDSSGSWLEGSDPGMPVAHAVARGLIKREEVPPATWAAIEILVTLADL